MTINQCPVSEPNRSATPMPAPDCRGQSACPATREEAGRFIPYITPLKGETPSGLDVILRADGLGVTYADGERDGERDARGALWARTAPPSEGRPIPFFRKVHPQRAGRAMLDMRCQGCLGKPDRNSKGVLFFVKPDSKSRSLRYWPQTEYTHHPPVCLPCAREAMRVCSFVQEAPAQRVQNPRPWGVDCLAFAPDGRGGVRPLRDITRCSYDDLKLLPWTMAIQPIARLSRCTVVSDIRAELIAAGLELSERRAS